MKITFNSQRAFLMFVTTSFVAGAGFALQLPSIQSNQRVDAEQILSCEDAEAVLYWQDLTERVQIVPQVRQEILDTIQSFSDSQAALPLPAARALMLDQIFDLGIDAKPSYLKMEEYQTKMKDLTQQMRAIIAGAVLRIEKFDETAHRLNLAMREAAYWMRLCEIDKARAEFQIIERELGHIRGESLTTRDQIQDFNNTIGEFEEIFLKFQRLYDEEMARPR